MQVAIKMVDEAVELYNGRRLHRSLKMQTPNDAHASQKHKYATYRKQKPAAEYKVGMLIRFKNILKIIFEAYQCSGEKTIT